MGRGDDSGYGWLEVEVEVVGGLVVERGIELVGGFVVPPGPGT
jgi:hypothetical protein